MLISARSFALFAPKYIRSPFNSISVRYSSSLLRKMEPYIPLANKFVDFVNEACTPFHAVDQAKKILEAKGFSLLSEKQDFAKVVVNGGKYFFTRNQSTIIAFAVGKKYKHGNGFNIVAAHTDSPNLKIRPNSAVESAGYLEVGCELYGGGLWHTWFDRDLTVAGRVIVKRGDKFVSELVKLDKAVLRIPTLAIHLDRSVNTDGFKYNTQNHVLPIISTAVKNQLGASENKDEKPKHHAILLQLLAKKLNCEVSDINNFDLSVCDTQPSAIGGALDEFIFSPRCDNLNMSFCALQALVAASDESLNDETNVRVVMLFDNEEVGSSSAHGAASPLLLDTISRITSGDRALTDLAIRNSFLVSADMAHALHPNYASHHEARHQPAINKGIVIKHNANLRYCTTAPTAFVMLELAKRNEVPIQEFVVKNDSPCGSTIGPIMTALGGIRGVDLGNPQLSMHRETCGVADVTHATSLFKAFFEQFTALDAQVEVDA